MTWDEYYMGFYEWAESTQISRMSTLTDFGPSDEIVEIVQNFYDEKIATRLIRKALDYGVKFTTDEIIELRSWVSDEIYPVLVQANSNPYTYEKLDELYGLIDDKIIEKLAKKNKVRSPMDEEIEEVEKVKSPGFWGTLFALLGSAPLDSPSSKLHNGRCNGDCANCPPHYGYRYGRWYYGHDHTRGCEFGGNKCGGGL
ncbi:MAG: hypothetical protein IJN25_09280 [Clostridia bacterium]|nr:hypothetical protein [Clostridia bacterium]